MYPGSGPHISRKKDWALTILVVITPMAFFTLVYGIMQVAMWLFY